jgi:asparagine synthase (glutamine-hydrolysing)
MCGFTGYFCMEQMFDQVTSGQVLKRMTGTLVHRGPDSEGFWLDHDDGIALGHRRLAILDQSKNGAQPMHSATGRYVIAFNGEIYNHLDLRKELEKEGITSAWKGHSDTETLLAGFDIWGIEATIKKTTGMFAFAAWCRKSKTLILGRDRFGEKPLYYGWQGGGKEAVFIFGSELKALRAHPAFSANIDRQALGSYMRQMVVGGTRSIYTNISKISPGALLVVSRLSPEPAIKLYWSATDVLQHNMSKPFAGTAVESVDALESLLTHAIGQQMIADVPLGAFLSGGVDSSAIVALMQAQSTNRIRTFSIGFSEDAYNEAKYATVVAAHLGTEHTELYVTPQQAMEVIPRLPQLYDEPFADSSQIPTFLVSEMTRHHVKVALSGDGGDELFAGYNRYRLTASLWHRLEDIPQSVRAALAWGITRFPPQTLNRWARHTSLASQWASVGDKLHKGAGVMSSKTVDELYQGMVANGWPDPSQVVIGLSADAESWTGVQVPLLLGLSHVERMMALDMLNYLPDDILTKVDRAAMGVGLETRVPFLDHQIAEFAWSLPLHYKLRQEHGQLTSKWVLREVLRRHIPPALIERPKMGFGVPLEHWLRGPLRDWAEDLLSEQRLKREGYLNPIPIRQKWAEHLSGRRNWQHPLWCVLMFQAWLSEQSATVSSYA